MSSEAIRAIKTVKSFANEELEAEMYDEKLKELYETSKRGFIAQPALRLADRVSFKGFLPLDISTNKYTAYFFQDSLSLLRLQVKTHEWVLVSTEKQQREIKKSVHVALGAQVKSPTPLKKEKEKKGKEEKRKKEKKKKC